MNLAAYIGSPLMQLLVGLLISRFGLFLILISDSAQAGEVASAKLREVESELAGP